VQRFLDACIECSLLGLYPHADHYASTRNIPRILSLYRQLYMPGEGKPEARASAAAKPAAPAAPRRKRKTATLSADDGEQADSDTAAVDGAAATTTTTRRQQQQQQQTDLVDAKYETRFRRALMTRLCANKFVLRGVFRELLVYSIGRMGALEKSLRERVWNDHPFAKWPHFKHSTVQNGNLLREYVMRFGRLPGAPMPLQARVPSAAATAAAVAFLNAHTAEHPLASAYGDSLVLGYLNTAAASASQPVAQGTDEAPAPPAPSAAAPAAPVKRKRGRPSKKQQQQEAMAMAAQAAEQAGTEAARQQQQQASAAPGGSSKRTPDAVLATGSGTDLVWHTFLEQRNGEMAAFATAINEYMNLCTVSRYVACRVKTVQQDPAAAAAAAAAAVPVVRVEIVRSPPPPPPARGKEQPSPSQQSGEDLFVKKASDSIVESFVKRDVLDVATVAANSVPAAMLVSTATGADGKFEPQAKSSHTPSSNGSNALGIVLYSLGYGSPGGNESGRLWNIKSKKASRRRKKKRQTAWVNTKNYRLYNQGFVEMLRHRLVKVYIGAFVKDTLTSAKHRPTQESERFLAKPDAAVQQRIDWYEGLGTLSETFDQSFCAVLLWLHRECGLSESGVRNLCDAVLKYCQRVSPNKIEDSLRRLSSQDYVLFKYYVQQDQRASMLRFYRLDPVTSVYALRAVQKKNRVYTNVCCASDRDYRRFARCDHERCYTLCYSKCCDRLTGFSLGESYGNYRVTDNTALEDLLDAGRVATNRDMQAHADNGGSERLGHLVDGTVIYHHPHQTLSCCMLSEKQAKSRSRKLAATGTGSPSQATATAAGGTGEGADDAHTVMAASIEKSTRFISERAGADDMEDDMDLMDDMEELLEDEAEDDGKPHAAAATAAASIAPKEQEKQKRADGDKKAKRGRRSKPADEEEDEEDEDEEEEEEEEEDGAGAEEDDAAMDQAEESSAHAPAAPEPASTAAAAATAVAAQHHQQPARVIRVHVDGDTMALVPVSAESSGCGESRQHQHQHQQHAASSSKAATAPSEALMKQLNKQGRQRIKLRDARACNDGERNSIIEFDALGKVVVACSKSGEMLSYVLCPECGNLSTYHTELWTGANGRYMCSQCFLSTPSNATVIFDPFVRNYYIVPPQLAYDICNDVDLKKVDNVDATRQLQGKARPAAPASASDAGNAAPGAASHAASVSGETMLHGVSSRSVLPSGDGVTTHVNIRYVRKRTWSAMQAALPVDRSGRQQQQQQQDDEPHRKRLKAGEEGAAVPPLDEYDPTSALSDDSELEDITIEHIDGSEVDETEQQQHQQHQQRKPAGALLPGTSIINPLVDYDQKFQQNLSLRHFEKGIDVITQSRVLYSKVAKAFLQVFYAVDDASAPRRLRLRKLVMSKQAAKENYYLSHAQMYTKCEQRYSVDLKDMSAVIRMKRAPVRVRRYASAAGGGNSHTARAVQDALRK
jgi:hypothetical protein